MNSNDFKSFLTAVFLSVLVVLGFNYFFPQQKAETNITQTSDEEAPITDEATGAAGSTEVETAPLPVADALKQDERLKINNGVVNGSIRLKGARFDEILLNKYKLTLDENSPDVELFSPAKTENAYYADYGWLSTDKSLLLPNKDTLWTVEGNQELTPQTPVTLVWNNGQGVKFVYVISIDDNYLFDITQTVVNNSGKEITIYPYGLFSRTLDKDALGRSIVHEGFTGVIDGDLKEIKYSKLDK